MKSKIELIQWIFLIASLGLFTITEQFDTRVVIGLVFLAGNFLIRSFGGNFWPRNTGLEGPLVLFVASAGIATWISYDFSVAILQFARILAAVALFSSISESSPVLQRWLVWGFLLAAFTLAIYWPLQHDFSSSAKFKVIDITGRWINSHLPEIKIESFTGPFIHPNVAGGTLALAVPFGVALVALEWQANRKLLGIMAGLLTLCVVFGMFLTGSRGTWVGLILALGGLLLAWIQRRWFSPREKKILFWSIILVAGLAGLAFVMGLGQMIRLVGTLPGPAGTAQSRFSMWSQGWGLAKDYLLTGSGFGTFWMGHALYSILIHVPFIHHAHNTLLEVWIEQGIFGAIALIWGTIVVLLWYWRALDRSKIPFLAVAGMVSLSSMALHGIIDVVFYIERTLPLVGFALGFSWLAVPEREPARSEKKIFPKKMIILLGGVSLLIIGGFLFRNDLLSTYYANMGSLEQSRMELSRYDPSQFRQLSIDQVRQTGDYVEIVEKFNKSLTYDPLNRTALLRLSGLFLSRGEYDQAWVLMQTAWKADHRDLTAQLLYGDAAVANGFPEEAAAALKGNPWAEARLMGEAWSRYWLHGDSQRALDAWKTVVILNPKNTEAAQWITKAESKLAP